MRVSGESRRAPSDAEQRFRELFESHVRDLLGYALRRVGSPEDASDVVADTMLVAWRRLGDVPTDGTARLWLYGVARRVLANHHRSGLRRERLGERLRLDVDTWLGAMPASVVEPADARATVDAMLASLPLPPGLDRQRLYQQETRDRYQVGATVSGAVACGWLDQWVAAERSGDAQKLKQAADALATSHGWKVLNDMNAEGDYPEALWEYASQVAKGQDPTGYQQGLGC
ncbi:MAG TPA: RNA polymerase sigma factor [Jatrophihabitantaceae bacterium]|jgi:RNA polymerase sigma-70 factor (ECF subfamily)